VKTGRLTIVLCGWSKVADYAHRAALRADPLGSNPPYQLGMSAACPVEGCRIIPASIHDPPRSKSLITTNWLSRNSTM
jgi:hypothetical protein